MENSSKLGFFQIIKESLKIPLKNPNFIFLTFLTSFPLFCFLVFYEIILHQILIESATILHSASEPFLEFFGYDYERLDEIGNLLGKVSPMALFLGFLFTATLHFLDLFNTTSIIDIASKIVAGEKPMSLKLMISRSINKARFKAPLITSLCSLSLAALLLLVLLSFATYICVTVLTSAFLVPMFVVLFMALLAKYVEWSAVWNVGIVISIVEDNRQGDVALLVSSYLTRCNRGGGFLLMLGFLGWRFGLRFAFLYQRWNNGNGSSIVGITAVHIGLVCLGNFLKWLALMLYFHDCKKRRSYQITDVEDSKIQK
ncbi:Detected protein of unknown function [Hibiscus syriacus]|uniref:Uncharacterized protein n=1 Tax=Hibiscus syriacus TaxID=106335 RepID=A0A6A2Y107_HIBSY|nr:uncharacterized protein LOC120187808 [Hibiscus syriacus]KAE8661294.1 Detected protein of unknown function [Hibiscus syriacus]